MELRQFGPPSSSYHEEAGGLLVNSHPSFHLQQLLFKCILEIETDLDFRSLGFKRK